MKSQNKVILIVLSCLATAIATVYWRDITFTMPAALPIGTLIIIIFVISMLFTDAWRLRTEHIIFAEGHYSIRQKDIIPIPWQETTKQANKDNPFNEDLMVCFTGGVDYFGISLGGPSDSPIIICPDIYLEKEGSNYHCHTFLDLVQFDQLPLYVQDHLIGLSKSGELKHRINFRETPIYYGNLSKMDNSATSDNLALERKFKQLNREGSWHEERQDRIIRTSQKDRDFSKKDISIVIPSKIKENQQDEE